MLSYDFDDKTLQGWTQVLVSETGPTELGVISIDDPAVGNSVPPTPLSMPMVRFPFHSLEARIPTWTWRR